MEKTYLEDDEYPEMLGDISGWMMKKYLPRNLEIMKPLENLSFENMRGFGAFPALMQFADPKIVEMFEALAEAGRLAADAYRQIAEFDQEMVDAGYPLMINATTTVAFDTLSDCLRGTIDTMTDLYEQPEYVLETIEKFYPSTLYGALAQAEMSPGKLVFIPLHKGLDGFMGNSIENSTVRR